MTVLEYLQRKYNRESPSILQIEAYIFKIPYPTKTDWINKLNGKKITRDMAVALIDYFKTTTSKSGNTKFATKILKEFLGENTFTMLPNTNKKKPVQKQPTIESVTKFISRSTIDPRLDSFLDSFEWRAIRKMALNLHCACCQCCGKSAADGIVLNVDHIKPRKFFPELALELDNLQVLCSICNHGKGNWDMTDSR